MKKTLIAALMLALLPVALFAQQPVTGSITATSSNCTSTACVMWQLPQGGNTTNIGTVAMQVTGTFSATLQFEAAIDGNSLTPTFVAIYGFPIGSSTPATSTTSTGLWQFSTAGLSVIRVRASAYTSGTAVVLMTASNPNFGGGGGGVGGGGGPVTIADGADVAEGSTTVDRCATTDTTTCTLVGLAKQTNWFLENSTGQTTLAGSNSVNLAYPTLASGFISTAMTGTTSTVFGGGLAATANNYIYLTSCTTSNSSLTVSTDILLQDGSGGTTLYVLPAPAAAVATTGGGGGTFTFPMPIKVPTAGNALYAANVTSGSSTKISCSGFKSTISY